MRLRGPHGLRVARRAERGMTLIDTLVAITLMSLVIVTIGAAFATAARNAATSTDQARISAAMNAFSTWVVGSSANGSATPVSGSTSALPYQFCASASSYNAEIKNLLPASFNASYPGFTEEILSPIVLPDAGSVTFGGTTESPLQPSCGDYGVQRIQLKVTNGATGRSQTQTVYKGLGATTTAPVVGPSSSPTPSPGLQNASWTCTGNASGEPYIFYQGGQPVKSGQTPTCAVLVPSGCTQTNCSIGPGSTIGAIYDDEKNINKTPPCTAAVPSCPTFTVDGVSYDVSLSAPMGQWIYQLTITLGDLAPGCSHIATITAWDTDQNKQGGDFGQVTFTFFTC